MDVHLASILFSWLLHIDLSCIVCQWDPATNSWVPWVGGGAGGIGGGLGLNDLFGGEVGGGAVGDTSVGTSGGAGAGDTAHPEDTGGLGEPVNPDTTQTVPPGSPPPLPSEYRDRSDPDARVRAEETEQQRARDSRHARYPGETTAPPQPTGPTTTEQVGGFFYRSSKTIGH